MNWLQTCSAPLFPFMTSMSLIVQSSLSLNCRGCFIISLITYIQVGSKVLVSSYINVIDLNYIFVRRVWRYQRGNQNRKSKDRQHNCQKKKDKVHLPFNKFTRIAAHSLKLHYNFTTVDNSCADFQQVHVLKFVHAVSL